MIDPIVDEVRQTRLKIEQECAKSGISYKDHLLAVQIQYVKRLVTPPGIHMPVKKADKSHIAARNLLLERLSNQEPTGVQNWTRDKLYERTA